MKDESRNRIARSITGGLIVALLLLAAPALAETQQIAFDTTVIATADAYNKTSMATNNFGAVDSIIAGLATAERLSYLYFPLVGTLADTSFIVQTAICSLCTDGNVTLIPKLSLFKVNCDWFEGAQNNAIDSAGLCDSWRGWSKNNATSVTGATITVANMGWATPRYYSMGCDSITISETNRWYAWPDLVPLVQSLLDTPATNFGMALGSNPGVALSYAFFHSKECTHGFKPRLVISGYYVVDLVAPDPPTNLSVDTTDCEVAVLTWTYPPLCDSIFVLRNGAAIDTVDSGAAAYSDSASDGWQHGWSLIAVNAGLLSDTTAVVYGTLARCDTVDYALDASCAGAWYMNGASAVTETDRSGEGNDLISNSGAGSYCCSDRTPIVSTSPAYTGTSRLFSFGTGYLSKTDTVGSLSIDGADAKISIVAWVKVMTVPANGTTHTIAGKWSASGNNRQYRFSIMGTGSGQCKFAGMLSADGTATDTVLSATTTFNDSTYYHVAFVADDANLILYVNGDTASSPVAHTAGIARKAATFTIGSQYAGISHFYGYVDEVAVFDRDLSAAEVRDIYVWGLTDRGASDYPLYRSYCTGIPTVPSAASIYQATDDSITALLAANGTWVKDTLLPLSFEGRRIMAVVVAPSGYTKTILLDGVMHGWERIPHTILLNFLRFLSDSTERFPRIRWVVVPLVNPDGATAGTYYNANDVNLNMNFDADWINNSEGPKGDSAESEPETRALARAVDSIYFPDLCIDLHTNANRVWVPNAYLTAYAANINPYLIDNGFGPLPTYLSASGRGMAFRWAYDTLGIKSYGYEVGQSDTTEEINRGIAALISFADHLQYSPIIDTITVATCSLVTITWTEDVEPDSVRMIRDGARIDIVAGNIKTYVDTLATLGTHRYNLIGFFDGGQPSDTSDHYDVTLSPPVLAKEGRAPWGRTAARLPHGRRPWGR